MKLMLIFFFCGLTAQEARGHLDANNQLNSKNDIIDGLKSIITDAEQLCNMTLAKYNTNKAAKHEEFLEALAKHEKKCLPSDGPNQIIHPDHKPKNNELARRLYALTVRISKQFTKSELFDRFVKGGFSFGLMIVSYSASLFSGVPQCDQNISCTMLAKSLALAAKEFVNSPQLDDVSKMMTQAIRMIVDLVPEKI